jgi:uncharacterized SAM-binding protein YcdF (DUF218 family)
MIDFTVSHFLQSIIFPPGIILLLLFFGIAVLSRARRAGHYIIFGTCLFFWVLSTPIFSQWLIDSLQNQYQPFTLSNPLQADEKGAIVILAGGVEDANEYPSKYRVSMITLARTQYAAYLAKQLQLPIIASGGNRNKHGDTEASAIKGELNDNYQLPVAILEDKSKTTAEESKLLLPLLIQNHITMIYLVTHAWHMPRSLYTFNYVFRNSGIRIIASPMGYVEIKSEAGISNYLPLLNALNTSVIALHEYVGLLWYRAFID